MSEQRPHLSIAGIPIRIEWSFWLIAVLLGYGARTGWLLVAWVVIVLVSILVHELGHAVALRIYHQRPRVVLHAFGGLTYGSSAYRSRAQSIVVSAAGPFTAVALLGVPAYFWQDSIDLRSQYDLYVVVHDVAWVNIGWSLVNLLPILPLDGGNIAASIFGRPAARMMSMVAAFGAATYFFTNGNQFGGFFLMMFAIMNFGSYQQEKAGGAPSVPTPQTRIASLAVPSPTRAAGTDDREQLEGLAWSALRTGDVGGARRALARHPDGQRMSPFLSGSLALAEGRAREGIDAPQAQVTPPSPPARPASCPRNCSLDLGKPRPWPLGSWRQTAPDRKPHPDCRQPPAPTGLLP